MKAYEVIQDIQNSCKGNQMRDVFYEEIETDDPEAWIRSKEPLAVKIEREDVPDGVRFRVWNAEILTVYHLSEID